MYICIHFRETGPKSSGPVPESGDRSHKSDFYGTSPIKEICVNPAQIRQKLAEIRQKLAEIHVNTPKNKPGLVLSKQTLL